MPQPVRTGASARHAVRPGVQLTVPLTQEHLGRMVGASREAVNRSLVTLSRQGLVRTQDRRFVIADLPALTRLADQDVA
ncbi:MAG TPA: helix-turn-helix domain-containing protein [Actinomycetota bacterium]|nr:helix-turn-helix domain-containing protein [Actinomycetota bacterium]